MQAIAAASVELVSPRRPTHDRDVGRGLRARSAAVRKALRSMTAGGFALMHAMLDAVWKNPPHPKTGGFACITSAMPRARSAATHCSTPTTPRHPHLSAGARVHAAAGDSCGASRPTRPQVHGLGHYRRALRHLEHEYILMCARAPNAESMR